MDIDTSEETRFVAQEFEFEKKNYTLDLNAELFEERRFNKKDLIKRLNIERLEQEYAPSVDPEAIIQTSKCLIHKEENLQFYCFNKDQFLCSECLISGKYAGLEVSNVKKAVDRLKNQFTSLIIKAIDKFEAFNLIEEEIEASEDEIEKATSNLEEIVVKQMNKIRQKINDKEQEILNNIFTLRQERLTSLKTSTKWLQNYREEIESVKYVESDLASLEVTEVCKYYSGKINRIKSFVSSENNFSTRGIIEMIENFRVQDNNSLSKIEEDCKIIKDQLENLALSDSNKIKHTKQTPASSLTKEAVKPIETAIFLPEKTLPESRKKSRELDLKQSIGVPAKLNTTPKATFLLSQSSEDILEINPPLKNPSYKHLDTKHLLKMNEIRSSTPIRPSVLEIGAQRRESKKIEIGTTSILVPEQKRHSSTKRTNRSGLSFNDSSSILENYKDIFVKRPSGLDTRTPKNVVVSISPGLAKPYSSTITSPSNFITINSLLSNSSIKFETLEKSEDKGKGAINNLENFASQINQSSNKALLRKSESAYDININSRIMPKRNVSEKAEIISSSNNGFRNKLSRLSSELFK